MERFQITKEQIKQLAGYDQIAEELPNHDGTEREIDGQIYLLTLKK